MLVLSLQGEVGFSPSPMREKTTSHPDAPYPSYPDTLLDLPDQQSAKPFLAFPICSPL